MRVLVASLIIGFMVHTVQAAPDKTAIKIQVDEGPNPWTSLDIDNDPEQFQFAIVTDRTGGHRPGIFEDGVRKLNLLRPEFVMSVGDLIEGYEEDLREVYSQWDEFQGFVAQLEMPFFYVPGNHDISNATMEKIWIERFGRKYYHFVYRDVLFLCIDSEDPPRTNISKEQTEYFRKVLEENKDVRWTLAFLHKPMWTYGDDAENGWPEIENLLEGRKYTVFAGHNHDYVKYDRRDRKYFILATTGGGTQLRGPVFGEFDHLVWVTMTDEGPVLANLMLEGIWDENVRTEDVMIAMENLLNGHVLNCDPIIVDGVHFEGAKTRYRIKNDADVPMEIKASFPKKSGLEALPGSFEKTVPPNSVEFVDVEFRQTTPLEVAKAGAIRADWTAKYAFEDHRPVEIGGSRFVPIDAVLPLVKKKGITIDGDLGEWGEPAVVCTEPGELQQRIQGWKGPEDCSFRFSVIEDGERLFLGVETRDEMYSEREGRRSSDSDGLEIRIDLNPTAEAAAGNRFVAFTQAIKDATPTSAAPLPEGLQTAVRKTSTGHTLEVSLPVSIIEAAQGADWKSVRINIGVNDRDGEEVTRVWWRPDWDGSNSFPTSGTFSK